jgi:hypothetical protein
MRRVSSILVLLVVMTANRLPVNSVAAEAPVPLEVMLARTVYIQKGATYPEKKDPTGEKSYVEPCREEIAKWGRLKVVDDPKDAHIILRISSRVEPGMSIMMNNQIRQSGNGYTFLEAVNPYTGKTVWATTHSWARSWSTKSATAAVVKELRKRVEEQEKLDARTH